MSSGGNIVNSIWDSILQHPLPCAPRQPAMTAFISSSRPGAAFGESRLMHGRNWRSCMDLSGWLLSEKYNGCRAYWDGAHLWTRGGHAVRIPEEWESLLPAAHLDCEIYAGRDGFKTARLATQYGRFTAAVRLMVFDANSDGDFIERQQVVREAVAGLEFAVAVEHKLCRSTHEALRLKSEIQHAGGEGLIARDPDNWYQAGRTDEILKLK